MPSSYKEIIRADEVCSFDMFNSIDTFQEEDNKTIHKISEINKNSETRNPEEIVR
jgi:hypothetical protein